MTHILRYDTAPHASKEILLVTDYLNIFFHIVQVVFIKKKSSVLLLDNLAL